jgi:hypothetical protein
VIVRGSTLLIETEDGDGHGNGDGDGDGRVALPLTVGDMNPTWVQTLHPPKTWRSEPYQRRLEALHSLAYWYARIPGVK